MSSEAKWRWSMPADHNDVAARQEAKKFEKRIAAELDRAAADENVDFDALASKVTAKINKHKADKKGTEPQK